MQCNDLPVECMNCALNFSCIYGETLQSLCEIKSGVSCVVKSIEIDSKNG